MHEGLMKSISSKPSHAHLVSAERAERKKKTCHANPLSSIIAKSADNTALFQRITLQSSIMDFFFHRGMNREEQRTKSPQSQWKLQREPFKTKGRKISRGMRSGLGMRKKLERVSFRFALEFSWWEAKCLRTVPAPSLIFVNEAVLFRTISLVLTNSLITYCNALISSI